MDENEQQINNEQQQDGKQFVQKKRRERIVRKGRMKQERFRAFMRFFLSVGIIIGQIGRAHV